MTERKTKEFKEIITAKCMDFNCRLEFINGAVHPNAKRHHKATGHKVVVTKKFIYE